ncbi:hypothetical protein, partial [Lysobacter sp. A3-1-A15]|uniref:hypothetical protein n=1 Tax=Novilysobacter viscosus TaxID=3098602 RepID=UPI003982FD80
MATVGSPCNHCGCQLDGGAVQHVIVAALRIDDLDRAIRAGLLADLPPCTGCSAACSTLVATARADRLSALAARDRHRAR